eukprot:COSAG02_NODE_63084_length_264_cov_0.624242_1_plen_64_part_10
MAVSVYLFQPPGTKADCVDVCTQQERGGQALCTQECEESDQTLRVIVISTAITTPLIILLGWLF